MVNLILGAKMPISEELKSLLVQQNVAIDNEESIFEFLSSFYLNYHSVPCQKCYWSYLDKPSTVKACMDCSWNKNNNFKPKEPNKIFSFLKDLSDDLVVSFVFETRTEKAIFVRLNNNVAVLSDVKGTPIYNLGELKSFLEYSDVTSLVGEVSYNSEYVSDLTGFSVTENNIVFSWCVDPEDDNYFGTDY